MLKAHRVIEAAEQHGRDSEPDHEIGDLQDALRAAIAIMNPEQIRRWAASEEVRNVLESGGEDFARDLAGVETDLAVMDGEESDEHDETFSESQIARLESEYAAVSGDPVRVEVITGRAYVFTTELGAMRLSHKMRMPEDNDPRVDYSRSRESWFFAFNLNSAR